MAVAGAIAAAGIATNALHLVIGAMVIAPGFEPLLKISLGIAAAGTGWKRGARQTGAAYGVLVVGALVAAPTLRATGITLPADEGAYLGEGAARSLHAGAAHR